MGLTLEKEILMKSVKSVLKAVRTGGNAITDGIIGTVKVGRCAGKVLVNHAERMVISSATDLLETQIKDKERRSLLAAKSLVRYTHKSDELITQAAVTLGIAPEAKVITDLTSEQRKKVMSVLAQHKSALLADIDLSK